MTCGASMLIKFSCHMQLQGAGLGVFLVTLPGGAPCGRGKVRRAVVRGQGPGGEMSHLSYSQGKPFFAF